MENGEQKPGTSHEPAAPSVPAHARILPPTQEVLPPDPEPSPKRPKRTRNRARKVQAAIAEAKTVTNPATADEQSSSNCDSRALADALGCKEDRIRLWPTLKKQKAFCALRTIPLDELNFETAYKILVLAAQLGIKTDKPFKKRMAELRREKEGLPPLPVQNAPVKSAVPKNSQFDYIENIDDCPGQYKTWPIGKKWKFYNDLCAIPLEEMTPFICHKLFTMAGVLKITPDDAITQRRAQLKAEKKARAAVGAAVASQSVRVPGENVFSLKEEPNESVPGMLNVLRNALNDAHPKNVNPAPAPFDPFYFPPLAPPPVPPFIPQPGPSGLPWASPTQPMPYRPPDVNYQPMQNIFIDRPVSREEFQHILDAPGCRSSPRSGRSRGSTSPSPKRQRREQGQIHDEYGTRAPTPCARDLAVSENYVLELPKHKIEPFYRAPVTIQEMQSSSDMVFLCQFRDSTAVTKPFLHPSSEMIIKRLARYIGPEFDLKESVLSSAPSGIASSRGIQRTRCEVSVWINGITRLVTLGEGVDPDLNYATNFAYASAMAALCYMMVIPYQLVQVVQSEGPEHIDLVIFACKQRIREMIAVSREPVYGLLTAYNGGLTTITQPVRDLWGIYINRMRHAGMEFWESGVIAVPPGVPFFSGSAIPHFYFTCARANSIVLHWAGMTPIQGEIVNFDVVDYNNVFSCSRFFELPAETGLIQSLSPAPCIESLHNYHLRFKDNLDVDINKFDPIVHMPFRDLLYRNGIGWRNAPRFSFFLLKYIGMRWKRPLILEHKLEIDVINGVERWKHVVTLSFQGVPYIFLGGKCRGDSFPTALRHAGSVVAEQLANMMIIPRELCYFLEKEGKKWAAIVVYVCRHRFAAFEALVRNHMFASLHNLKTANLEMANPLYKLAESFYWRMRSVGFLYWVDNHRNLRVPSSFGRVPRLPEDAFFKFVDHYKGEANWNEINAVDGVVDNFHPPALKLEDRIWTVWEGGARFDLERSPEREIEKEVCETVASGIQDRRNAASAELQKHQFEKALEDDFAIPLNALSNAECSAVLNLVRSLAATCKNKGLQMTIGRGPDPIGRDGWRCDMSWSGKLKWILSTVYYSPSERDLQFGAAWEMYKLLVLMGLFPPGLFKFIGNHEARLPCVIASLAPFMKLLETSLPSFMNHPDEENNRHLLLEHMRKLFVVEWQHRTMELPSELVPCIEEQNRLPFIRVDTMSDETEQLWRLSSPHFQRMAKIMDDRGRDVTQKTTRPEPGMKIRNLSTSKPPIMPKKTPPKPMEPVRVAEPVEDDEDDDDIDFEEELRQLEELCKSAVNRQNAAAHPPADQDEYL